MALDLQFYSNGGHSHDLSYSVMDRCLLHCDGCYTVPNLRARGAVCKTNQSSHTAFRGFGGPQVGGAASWAVVAPAAFCATVAVVCFAAAWPETAWSWHVRLLRPAAWLLLQSAALVARD